MIEYVIEKGNINEKYEIEKLYKSLIGQNGCTWDNEYPSSEIIEDDIKKGETFCLKKDNKIIAVATLTKDLELKKILNQDKEIYLLTRVAVDKEYQGQGYSKVLLQFIFEYAIKQNIELIYLLVNKSNKRAKNLYKKFDFKFVQNIKLHKLEWELLVKII